MELRLRMMTLTNLQLIKYVGSNFHSDFEQHFFGGSLWLFFTWLAGKSPINGVYTYIGKSTILEQTQISFFLWIIPGYVMNWPQPYEIGNVPVKSRLILD